MLFIMLPLEAAAIASMLGGYLLLPSAVGFDVPLLPPLDKFSIPAVTTLVLCWMKGTSAPAPRRSLLIYLLAFAFIVSPILSTFNNSYELHVGERSLPGFYPLDGVKMSLHNAIALAPFFIGMRFLSSEEARARLLKALPAAGLLYSLPMLLEVRMSPQLHRWVYGFHPHSFAQQVRDGGYRPVVFLGHGLEVAFFAAIAVIAAVIAMRARWRILHVPPAAAAAYLGVVLLLCKTMGALIYAAIAAPLALFTTPRTWVRVACVVVMIVCAYPILRQYDLVPVHRIAEAAKSISAERSASFQARVKNEDMLLAKANQKPFFGWGTFGRNRVYDQTSGEDVSITDGHWIIQFSMFGWLGYLSLFGLFAVAVLRARKVVRGPVTQSTIVLGGMCLLLAVNVVDLLPNANLLPLTFLMAGSIAGCVRATVTRKFARLRAPQTAAAAVPA